MSNTHAYQNAVASIKTTYSDPVAQRQAIDKLYCGEDWQQTKPPAPKQVSHTETRKVHRRGK